MRRRTKWSENIDSPTIYSPEQYQQLSSIPGSPDEAADRLDVSKTELRELCTRLEVDEEVADEAIQLYRQVIRTNLVNNYSSGSLIAATVYAACRKYEVPRTTNDIAEAAYVLVDSTDNPSSRHRDEDYLQRGIASKRELRRVYNQIRNQFDRRYAPVEPEKFAQRYCDELDLKEQVAEFVEVVIKRVDDEVLSGMSPDSIAAGAIYYASQELDLDVTQRNLEPVSQCSAVTIRKTRDVIKESIEP